MAYPNDKKNSNNPRNSDSFLYKALTRLLSGPLTQYQTQNPRQLKRWQLDKYKFQSAAGLTFKKTSFPSIISLLNVLITKGLSST